MSHAIQSTLTNGLKNFGAVLLLLCFLGFWVGTDSSAPSNAQVLAHAATRRYIAPPCVERSDDLVWTTASDLEITTIREARARGFKRDDVCNEDGAFRQEGRSATGLLLQKLGVLDPLSPRWNADGSWNW